jgi:double zinc ribbon protein
MLLFLVVLWLALVFWTWSDARRRISDPMLVGTATAASLFPFVGTIVYMIVRPPEYLEDVRERELEIAAAEARLASVEHLACPYCGFEVEQAFLRCPSCLRRLKEPCNVCRKPLDPRWKICPYCEAEVGAAAPTARRVERERRPRPARAAAAGGSRPSAPPRQEPRQPDDGQRAEAPRRAQRPSSAG